MSNSHSHNSPLHGLSSDVNRRLNNLKTANASSPDQEGNNLPSGLSNQASIVEKVTNAFKGVKDGWNKIDEPIPIGDGDKTRPPTAAEQNARRARLLSDAVNAGMAALSMPQDMLNMGFANLTAPLAAIWPKMPAATLLSLYIGIPHAHDHPPSACPAPVPLPSLGPVLLGTCVQVLINFLPAARAGDIGLAPTCGGLFPWFEIKTGSSNVFIGGSRAARMGDICMACFPATSERAAVMSKIGKIAQIAEKVLDKAGYVAGGAGIVADLAEAAVQDDSVEDGKAMKEALALSAVMTAAQMAADAIAMALTKTMGKDPAITPAVGAIALGHPNVLIGGFPMINIPNPIELILRRLKHHKGKPKKPHNKENEEGKDGFPPC